MTARSTSLLEAERFLRSTLDALGAPVAVLDADGVVVEVNSAWKHCGGEIAVLHSRLRVGDNYLEICDAAVGDDSGPPAAVAAGIRELITETRDEFHAEYSCRRPRGQRWFIVRITRFRNDEKVGVVVAHEDITERKLAEQAIGLSNDRFHQLADHISDAFWFRSPDLRELHYVSPGFERIWGRPASVLYADPGKWVEFIWPEDRPRVFAAFGAFTSDNHNLDIEYRITRPDNEVRWVRVRGSKVRDATGQPIRLVGIVTDITDKRGTERALQESEERMRLQTTALDAAANGVFITDRRGIIQWVNAAFTRLTGYSAAEAIGQDPRLLKSGQHSESSYRQLWQTITAGRVWNGEIINRRKDGQFYHEDMTITPVRDAGGDITHFIAVKQDISERKRAEASIQDLHKKLVLASRQAGMADVAADVLHNVGNALNSVNVSASVVLDHVRQTKAGNVAKLASLFSAHASDLAGFLTSDPVGRKIPGFIDSLAEALATEKQTVIGELDELRKNIEHINEIVARQQSHARIVGVFETFSVTDMVEDALRINDGARTGHEIDVVRDYQARPTITTDKHKVTQLIIDVVRNARRACDRSGRAEKQITVRITSDGERVKIAVSDNGTGIAPDEIARLFSQKFGRREEGHDFALHRGANTATELGGSLSIASDGAGHGATFVLELPCQSESRWDENEAP